MAATTGCAVDFERQRRAENRQAVRVVRRAVDGIEHPAVMRNLARRTAGAELFTEHGMVGEALRDHRAEPALDLDVDLGDEIDRAFLVDAEIAAEVFELDLSRLHDRFDGRGEQQRLRCVSHRPTAS